MAIDSQAAALSGSTAAAQNDWLVIGASSLGTIFEWYDFYLYGLLATVISATAFVSERADALVSTFETFG